jgi:hypothetical protein
MAIQVDSEIFSDDAEGNGIFKVRFLAESRAEALTGIPGTYEGLTRTGRQNRPWHPGKAEHIVDATYEGIISDDPGPEFDQFDLDTEEREERIESFPDRQSLIDVLGAFAEDGKLKFPELIPERDASSVSGGAFSGIELSPGEPNPFFNLTSYPVSYGVGIHSFVRKKPKSGFDKMNNQIVETIPSGFEYKGAATRWRVLTRRSKQGNAWRHEATYRELDHFVHIEALNRLIREGRSSGGVISSVRA